MDMQVTPSCTDISVWLPSFYVYYRYGSLFLWWKSRIASRILDVRQRNNRKSILHVLAERNKDCVSEVTGAYANKCDCF